MTIASSLSAEALGEEEEEEAEGHKMGEGVVFELYSGGLLAHLRFVACS